METLAERLRVDATDPALTGIGAAVEAYLDNVGTLNLPDAVRNEAYIRMAGYLYDAPATTNFYSAFKSSGAASLLAPWVQHEAGVLEAS